MQNGSKLNEFAAQQLVRYEALFKLLDDIQGVEDIALMSRCVAQQWKYFANVSSWRLTVFKSNGFLCIDGFRGETTLDDIHQPSEWDMHHIALQRPRLIQIDHPWDGPPPPDHLYGKYTTEIQVLPVIRGERWVALLSTSASRQRLSELDKKFIRIFGNHFADRVSDTLYRRQATEDLINRASHDALTGLLNRGAIIEHLNRQLALAKRSVAPLSVILADIDFFKIINDTHGHLAGDTVLHEISVRLQGQTRSGDRIGRYGGEEFLFVLYPCGGQEILKIAERYRRAIAEKPFQLAGEKANSGINVTISLGCASTDMDGIAGMETLLKQADNALYRSKAEGRNRVTMNRTMDFSNSR